MYTSNVVPINACQNICAVFNLHYSTCLLVQKYRTKFNIFKWKTSCPAHSACVNDKLIKFTFK